VFTLSINILISMFKRAGSLMHTQRDALARTALSSTALTCHKSLASSRAALHAESRDLFLLDFLGKSYVISFRFFWHINTQLAITE